MAKSETILVVDDSDLTREILERNLRGLGYVVQTADSVAGAIRALEGAHSRIDLIITDYRMPEADGLSLVRHIRTTRDRPGVIMITGFATVGGAVAAMREGVEDYLAKPFSDEELRHAVESSLEKVRSRRGLTEPDAPAPHGMIGRAPAMQRVYRLIERAAATDVPVMIYGESGTGKELVARGIHYAGHRASGPFIAVNCAAIPETLIESELFGHTKGAFTGASTARAGLFTAADGGTLFLDELGELSPLAQAKLLRVIQEKQVQAVGADRVREVDVRIVAATNKDLSALAADGLFRQDLLFRLNVLPIELPPLRERGDDVKLLMAHFLNAAAAEHGLEAPKVTADAADELARYAWPGNVRELQNVMHRLVILSDGAIDVGDIPEMMRKAGGRSELPTSLRPLKEVELEHIRAVLDAVGGNKTRAAQILGIDRKSLRERLKAAVD